MQPDFCLLPFLTRQRWAVKKMHSAANDLLFPLLQEKCISKTN
jgi:hypothetical protein